MLPWPKGRSSTAVHIAHNVIRKLSAYNMSFFKSDPALSLHNLANRLSEIGRREVALKRVQEAVVMYRELAEPNASAFTPDLARSLHNLSIHLSELGRKDETLERIEEAVPTFRELTEKTQAPSHLNS